MKKAELMALIRERLSTPIPKKSHRGFLVKNGQIACRASNGTFLISAIDAHFLSKYTWSLAVHADRCYVRAHKPGSGKRGKSVLLHRLIMNAPSGLVVDHIDGDGRNNTRENLRVCTTAQNVRNQPPWFSHQPKGVYKTKSGTWRAQIMVNYKKVALGTYQNQQDAASAYDDAAIKLHGEFARLNQENTEIQLRPGQAAEF